MIYINKKGILVVAIIIPGFTKEFEVIGVEELKDDEKLESNYYNKYYLGFLYNI